MLAAQLGVSIRGVRRLAGLNDEPRPGVNDALLSLGACETSPVITMKLCFLSCGFDPSISKILDCPIGVLV